MTYTHTLEIIEASATVDLTTLETAKDELNITDTSMDTKLTRWIHEASSAIASRINRVLGRETVKETFVCPSGSDGLPLSRYPVAFIDSVTEGDTSVLSSSDYRLAFQTGVLYRNYGFGTGYGSDGRWYGKIVVQYQAGYQLLDELPYDLERACLILLSYRKSASGRDPMLRSEAVPGVYEASYWIGSIPGSDASMPPEVLDLLTPYRDLAV
jgi:gp6-like head-tail connector protein